jgi:pentapeptide MXKDX repeat protein
MNKLMTLAVAVTFALGAAGAFAADDMKKDAMMKKDGMMKKEATKKGGMTKKKAMKKDGMMKTEEMNKNAPGQAPSRSASSGKVSTTMVWAGLGSGSGGPSAPHSVGRLTNAV